jgi:Methyltransferase domain
MKEHLKRIVGPAWRARAHRLSRLRWLTKYQIVRSLDSDAGLARRVAYVVLDPETESYTYDLRDEPGVITELAAALGYPAHELAAYAAELHRDPELNELLARHTRWRFDVKRRLPVGNRFAWYLLTRALKPQLVVETGIYLGLGSLVLLRALERNQEEGNPGELMSFDTDPGAGSFVRGQLRRGWHRYTGSTHELLLPALEGRRVNLLFQDTPHTEANQRFEFLAALSHAAPQLVLVDDSGWAHTLAAIAAEHHGSYHRLQLRSRNHVYPGIEMRFSVFDEKHAARVSGEPSPEGHNQAGRAASRLNSRRLRRRLPLATD